MDIARSAQVESELDTMIRRRDTHRRRTEGERLKEELYEPSVRAWRERQETEKRTARFEYHRSQADRLRRTKVCTVLCTPCFGITAEDKCSRGGKRSRRLYGFLHPRDRSSS